MRLLVALVILILPAPAALHAAETYDVFTFSAPSGWQRKPGPGRLEFSQVEGSRFCQMGLIQSGAGQGDSRRDFARDWKNIIGLYNPSSNPEPKSVSGFGKWEALTASTEGSAPGAGRFESSLYTFTQGNQVASLIFNGNHAGCASALRTFLTGLRLGDPSTPPSNPTTPPQAAPPTANNAGPANITRATIDDWQAEIFRDYVRFDRGGIAVLIFWNVSLNEQLRNGDLALNLWRSVVGRSFRILSEAPVAEEQFAYFRKNAVAGQVADNSGRRYAAFLTSPVNNGVASPFLALAPDDATLRRAFPDVDSLRAMQRFNYFPVNPAELAGRWTSSFSSAAESYYVSSGNYAGLTVASASVDYNFAPNGTYTEDTQAVTGRIGALNTSRQHRTGNWQVNANTLILRESNGTVTEYHCGLVAIGGGKALRIINKQYSGSRWDLLRAK